MWRRRWSACGALPHMPMLPHRHLLWLGPRTACAGNLVPACLRLCTSQRSWSSKVDCPSPSQSKCRPACCRRAKEGSAPLLPAEKLAVWEELKVGGSRHGVWCTPHADVLMPCNVWHCNLRYCLPSSLARWSPSSLPTLLATGGGIHAGPRRRVAAAPARPVCEGAGERAGRGWAAATAFEHASPAPLRQPVQPHTLGSRCFTLLKGMHVFAVVSANLRPVACPPFSSCSSTSWAATCTSSPQWRAGGWLLLLLAGGCT